MIRDKELFLFDIDGTICRGEQWIDGAKELLESLNEQGKCFMFMTNNSTKSRADYVSLFKKLGLKINESQIMTAGIATGICLAKSYDRNLKWFVIGTDSLKSELKNSGLLLTENVNEANGVIVGYDVELTYDKLIKACHILNNKDTFFAATNPDLACPDEVGFLPDCGAICEMIFHATGRKPFYIGKPENYMVSYIENSTNIPRSQMLLIGDRLYTDILCGVNSGIDTMAVLTGEATLDDIKNSQYKPDYIGKSVKDLLELY